MKKWLSLFLALSLLVTPAMASQALGWELVRSETVVGPGATVTTQKFWGDSKSDYRTEQFFTYTPGQGVSPAVVYGATVPSKATLTAMAKTLESGGRRVLAGANGDYFVVASGVPLGMVVTDGALRSSSSYLYAVGFAADGSAFVGQPQLAVWAQVKGRDLAVSGGYNKTRSADTGLTLFSRDFGAATKGSGEGVNAVLRPVTVPADYAPPAYAPPAAPVPPTAEENGDPAAYEAALAAYEAEKAAYETALATYETEYNAALAASAAALPSAPDRLAVGGGAVDCVVEQVTAKNGGVDIPAGCFVLSADAKAADAGELSALRVGERVSVRVTAPEARWSTAVQAIGAFALLLKDGAVQDGLDNAANPRTALGIRENGQVLLYTIDGRKSGHSVGASMKQVAARLKELGCVDAVLFDGGGSTTFGGTAALDSAFTLQNVPSDGGQRAVTNALFFVSDRQATGELGSIHLTPQSALLLPGGKVTLTPHGIDTGYYPAAGELPALTYSVSGPGQMTGNVFTAAPTGEKAEAVVTAAAPDGQSGYTVLTVVPTPHAITVSNEATGQGVTGLNLDPGQTVSLSAAAAWYGLPLAAVDESFTWAVTGGVGSVTPSGSLTAGSKAASGSLTVAAGAKTVSVPVSVAGHVTPLTDFEAGTQPFRVTAGGAAQLSGKQVKYGVSSMEVRCQAPETMLETDLALIAGETDVNFWVYCGEEIRLEAVFSLEGGGAATVSAPVDGVGQWRFVSAALPQSADALTGLRIASDGDAAVYFDHFTSTNGGLRDDTAPVVQVQYNKAENGPVTARLSDNMDKTFAKERVSLTVDGQAQAFTLSGNVLTADVSLNDGRAHRVSVTVTDSSGNIGRGSVQIDHPADMPVPGGGGNVPYCSPFADVQGHWAADYADYLYDQGVTNGSPGPDGGLYFLPGANITRGDFVTMLMRWLGTDLTKYKAVELPFADKDAIQPWAADAVKAAYALGIFTGSANGGALYADAQSSITRAQAMTLLGRVQPRGYAAAPADTFLDHAAIPAWAAEHVSSLVAQGVVSGYGGYVRPQDPITRGEVAKILSVMW